MNYIRKNDRLAAFCALFILFVGQFFIFGINRAPDTVRLEEFSTQVYPLYPAVLYLFRLLGGADTGYFILGIVQNLLLVLAIYSFTGYLKSIFQLDTLWYFLTVILIAFTFFAQKWFTSSGNITSDILISEALAIPLYILFFRFSLEAFMDRTRKPFLISCLFAALLILTRGPLYWTLLIVFFLGIRLTCKGTIRAFVSAVFACVVIVGVVQGSRAIQTAAISDKQTKSPTGLILLSTAAYCSEKEDALLFQADSGERAFFEAIREYVDDPANLSAFSYESGNLVSRHGLFEAQYDNLKGYIGGIYQEISSTGTQLSLNKITNTLILHNLGSFLAHCGQNALVGLIRTVAILRPGITQLTFLFYIGLLLYSVILRKYPALLRERQFVILALCCVLLNAATIAPGVFALSRYMFYNMPIFYAMAVILLRSLIVERKGLYTFFTERFRK